jgi:Holliday junction DNA helicase RuvA
VYHHLRGTLVRVQPARLVVETAGVGWDLTVPLSTSRRAGAPGDEIRLLTHLVVREDALELYGFLEEEERALFRSLVALSGIGPALALQVLSSVTPREFALAVEAQDVTLFKRIKGIGEKKAKRLILELKGARMFLPEEEAAAAPSGPAADAAAALEALGVQRREAEARVAAVLEAEPELPLEELVRKALR